MTAPGTAFPSDAECAAQVRRSSWEPRPENYVANHTVAPQPNTLAKFSSWTTAWNSTYKTRITGNFTGTTDEIIQWVACKWGWSDEVLRAQSVQESSWRESAEGDREARSRGHCSGHALTGARVVGRLSGALPVAGSSPPMSSRKGGYVSVISAA